jgi:hypothetical protein
MLQFITAWAPSLWALLPLALLSLPIAASRDRMGPIHLSLVFCIAVLIVMFADVGVGENHLIDLLVLSAILTGDLWGSIRDRQAGWNAGQLAVAAAVVFASLASLMQHAWKDAREATEMIVNNVAVDRYDPVPLKDRITPDTKLLAEDPYLAISRGKLPVVADPFMLLRLDQKEPQRTAPLIKRIRERDFQTIVLMEKADAPWRYEHIAFGPNIMKAIADNYEFAEQVHEYCVYLPKSAASPAPQKPAQ